jgi:CRISPR system Cascade subunit CasB
MTETHPFIDYLEALASRGNRGALAALRRGLGQPPGTVAAMYPYVVPWLSPEARPWQESAYYLVASLFSLHSEPGGVGNLGASFRLAAAKEPGALTEEDRISPIERRFTALLAAHPDDLPDRLRQAIGYLASKEVPVEWRQLFRDLPRWGDPSRRVQRDWARAYWGRERQETPEES